MDVPAPLARGAALLRCPVCRGALHVEARSLVCDARHTYDIARHGHVTLAHGPVAAGDDAAMVAARVAVFDAGHYAPLTHALARTAAAALGREGAVAPREGASGADEGSPPPGDAAPRGGMVAPDEGVSPPGDAAPRGGVVGPDKGASPRRGVSPRGAVVLDLGAGTGHHLAGVLPVGGLGFALDTSRPALRHAARAHPGVAAIVADVWRELPFQDAAVDLVLDVFSPRNGPEIARVLKPGGVALVAIPTAEHLGELADLHEVKVDPDKVERLERTVGAHLQLVQRETVRWTMDLDATAVDHVLRMSPAGAHRRSDRAPVATTVTGAVELWAFTTPRR